MHPNSMILSEIFEIKNGIPSNQVQISEKKDAEFSLPYLRPSSNYVNLIAGYLDRDKINSKYIFQAESIIVSTDGEGSHSYSYVSPIEFVPNSNVAVLMPKRDMSLKEKIYYSLCITRNRYRFSYGRKPKGERLKSINLPKRMPEKFEQVSFIDEASLKKSALNIKIVLSDREWRWFEYKDLFEVNIGRSIDLNKLKPSKNGINYVGRTEENNGITARVTDDGVFAKYEGNCITVPMVGNELKSSYQTEPFCVSQNIAILKAKNFNLNKYIALFLNTIIRKDRFRFTYGRTLSLDRLKMLRIKLPVD